MHNLQEKINSEVWKDIDGFEGYYQISNLGRVKSLKRQFVLQDKICGQFLNKKYPYYAVNFSKNGVLCRMFIHRLVAKHFVDNKNNYPQVNHKDGNKLNNNADNLEWCTQQQNTQHAYDMELAHARVGEASNFSVLTEEQARIIKIIKSINPYRSNTKISTYFEVSRRTIDRLVSGRTWKHIKIQ